MNSSQTFMATIRPGCGHWDTTCYPIGGRFHRSSSPIALTECRLVDHGPSNIGIPRFLIIGKNEKGRTLAASVEVCEIPVKQQVA